MRKRSFRLTALSLASAVALACVGHSLAASNPAAPGANPVSVTLIDTTPGPKLAIATFAGGCFWTMEHAFDKVPGVVKAISGYSGGHVKNPSYEDVSTGRTGHVETVEVHYDPAKISYTKLMDIYWHDIDPTQVGGQACDTGDEYRSMIFTHDATQMKQAKAYKDALQRSGLFKQTIAVQIADAGPFYAAEEYHQQFTIKNPQYYEQYRVGCGRDRRLQAIWGAQAHKSGGVVSNTSGRSDPALARPDPHPAAVDRPHHADAGRRHRHLMPGQWRQRDADHCVGHVRKRRADEEQRRDPHREQQQGHQDVLEAVAIALQGLGRDALGEVAWQLRLQRLPQGAHDQPVAVHARIAPGRFLLPFGAFGHGLQEHVVPGVAVIEIVGVHAIAPSRVSSCRRRRRRARNR